MLRTFQKAAMIIMPPLLAAAMLLPGCSCSGNGGGAIEVDWFSMSLYYDEVESFELELDVGEVDSPEAAIEAAKQLWGEVFGERYYNDTSYPTFEIKVSYNPDNDCWLVRHVFPKKNGKSVWLGVLPHALIKSDGKVLAVFYY